MIQFYKLILYSANLYFYILVFNLMLFQINFMSHFSPITIENLQVYITNLFTIDNAIIPLFL